MSATTALYATATYFSTESFFDYVLIAGTRYSGSTGPTNVAMASGDTLMIYADWSASAGGFTICGSTTPAALPPEMPPPPQTRMRNPM